MGLGGLGLASTITGTSVKRGGGGGSYNAANTEWGGGNDGSAGTANTGGGGGGNANQVKSGGAGGSGIVVLKYTVIPPTTVDVVQTFTASGDWIAPQGVTEVEYLVVAGGGGAAGERGG